MRCDDDRICENPLFCGHFVVCGARLRLQAVLGLRSKDSGSQILCRAAVTAPTNQKIAQSAALLTYLMRPTSQPRSKDSGSQILCRAAVTAPTNQKIAQSAALLTYLMRPTSQPRSKDSGLQILCRAAVSAPTNQKIAQSAALLTYLMRPTSQPVPNTANCFTFGASLIWVVGVSPTDIKEPEDLTQVLVRGVFEPFLLQKCGGEWYQLTSLLPNFLNIGPWQCLAQH
jgi:hypothetical protein